MGFAKKKRPVTKQLMKLKLLEVPKKHGEIHFFWFEEQVQAKQAFLQRSEYSSVHSLCFVLVDVARPSVEMVSRFLGFSLRNLVSRRCRRFGWRSKASGRMCAASARNFWIVVLWKSGIPDVENGETINNGVISPVNMESLLIQSTIRVGFGEILVLTMVYTTGGSWKSIGWQLGRSLVAPRRARGDLFLWFSKDGEINWHKVNCFGRCFCTTFAWSFLASTATFNIRGLRCLNKERLQVLKLWSWASVWWEPFNCNVETRWSFFVFSQ